MALTRKGSVFAWTSETQEAFERLKSCLLQALILGFPTEADRFVLDTDAVGGILNQIQGDREVVIAYASQSLRQSQRRYCATLREMLAAVMIFSCSFSFVHTGGAPITGPSDGFRSFVTATVCWHIGTCFSASSLLQWNIDRGLSMLMLMAFPVSVASVCGQIVR